MNWFKGNISEAVNESKAKNSIFTVFVEGTDELSMQMSKSLDEEKIRTQLESDKFVAVKIQSGSEAYLQFSQIYQIVPLPSVFFLGKNGTPIHIITGANNTVDDIDAAIKTVLATNATTPLSAAASSSSFIQGEQASGSQPKDSTAAADDQSEIVCEGGVCFKKPKPLEETQAEVAAATSPVAPLDERVERARKLIELQRKQKAEEEARLERNREIERRKAGQDAIKMQQRKDELELKNLKEERMREKQEEQAARKRILDQIAQDRAERAEKFGKFGGSPAGQTADEPKASTSKVVPPEPVEVGDFARIQFKKATGEIQMHTFNSSDTFSTIHSYVRTNILTAGDFVLSTTFPRREFKDEDSGKTLSELNLAPTAVVLVLPITKKIPVIGDAVSRNGGGIWGILMTIVYGVFSPLSIVYGYLKGWYTGRQAGAAANKEEVGAQKRAAEDNNMSANDAAKRRNLSFLTKNDNSGMNDGARPSGSGGNGARRRPDGANIHRLREAHDSDDENNTWNGNSTQQQ